MRSGNFIVPVQFMPCRAGPAAVIGHFKNAVFRYGRTAGAPESLPFAGAFSLVVPLAVKRAPVVPHAAGQPRFFQPHANGCPFIVGKVSGPHVFQRRQQIILIFHKFTTQSRVCIRLGLLPEEHAIHWRRSDRSYILHPKIARCLRAENHTSPNIGSVSGS